MRIASAGTSSLAIVRMASGAFGADVRPRILSRKGRSSSSVRGFSWKRSGSTFEGWFVQIEGALQYDPVLAGLAVDHLDLGRGVHRVDDQLADLRAQRRGRGRRGFE